MVEIKLIVVIETGTEVDTETTMIASSLVIDPRVALIVGKMDTLLLNVPNVSLSY
jgi:hypothetical protein